MASISIREAFLRGNPFAYRYPFTAPQKWAVAIYLDGIIYTPFKDRFSSYIDCQKALNELSKVFNEN